MWVILLTPPMRRLGFLVGAVDRPDSPRKVHTRVIARFGGPAVYLAFFLAFALMPFVSGESWDLFCNNIVPFTGLFIGATIVLAGGIYDDIKGLDGRYKFLLVIVASVVLYVAGFRIDRLYIPFWGSQELPLWLALPATVLWLTLCAAALNLIDGLDGLATGITLIAAITLLWLGFNDPTRGWENMLACSLIGAVIGFLIFNFNPAKIFLGDSGALVLGFLVGAISVKSSFKSTALATFVVPIVVLGLPILDTSMVILSRWVRHVSIFSPDRLHLHHRLMDQWGLSQRSAVFIFYIVATLFGGGALLISLQRSQWAWLPIAGVGLVIVLLLALLRCQEVSIAAVRVLGLVVRRKGSPRHWMERAHLFNALEEADSLPTVWQATTEIMSEFQVQYGGLRLEGAAFPKREDEPLLSWEWNGPAEQGKSDPSAGARWSAIYELRDGDRKLGIFYLERNVVGGMSIEGLGEVVTKLVDCLTKSLIRLTKQPAPSGSGPRSA
jgi:UDP-GlcNAc:undecaprenyl-phosphate/decaprenyl-phosphate GlcNAc-1-phosphate transferase